MKLLKASPTLYEAAALAGGKLLVLPILVLAAKQPVNCKGRVGCQLGAVPSRVLRQPLDINLGLQPTGLHCLREVTAWI